MAQHDYTIENQTFPATRTDLNNLYSAILSQNSGLSAPTTTTAYMRWADITNNVMKQRNAADSGWINLYPLNKQGLIPQDCGSIYATDSGTANAYAGTYAPAVTSLTTGQMFLLKAANANTGASTFNPNATGNKAIKKNGNEDLLPGDILAGQLLILQYDGTNFQLVSKYGTSRTLLTSNLTLYVRTDGNDSNTGLANTSGGAFLTVQAAINNACAKYDNGGYDITIQIADGTYTGTITLLSYVGSGSIIIQGNSGTPANVLISVTNAAAITGAQLKGCKWTLKDFKVTTTTSGNLMTLVGNSHIYFQNINFGAAASGYMHMYAYGGATFNATGNYTITGGGYAHMYAQGGGQFDVSGRTVTLTGTPAFSGAFAYSNGLGHILASGMTFTGSATGVRYTTALCGVINVGGGGASYLPGNSAGTTATGGQYA